MLNSYPSLTLKDSFTITNLIADKLTNHDLHLQPITSSMQANYNRPNEIKVMFILNNQARLIKHAPKQNLLKHYLDQDYNLEALSALN